MNEIQKSIRDVSPHLRGGATQGPGGGPDDAKSGNLSQGHKTRLGDTTYLRNELSIVDM